MLKRLLVQLRLKKSLNSYLFSGFICGKNKTSCIEALFVINIVNLSIPMPKPAVGGIPYSIALKKSSSKTIASSSPFLPSSFYKFPTTWKSFQRLFVSFFFFSQILSVSLYYSFFRSYDCLSWFLSDSESQPCFPSGLEFCFPFHSRLHVPDCFAELD